MNKSNFIITKDSYRTPKSVFDHYHQRFNFVLDAAASEHNALLPYYITEQENTHKTDWFAAAGITTGGRYAWMNPPYSDISPFVETAIKWQAKGFGCVMLVMMDQSVGWYKRAIECCQEVHLVIGGRLAFIDPFTGEPAKGNTKGSMILVFDPYGRPCGPRYRHIDRADLLQGVVGTLASLDVADCKQSAAISAATSLSESAVNLVSQLLAPTSADFATICRVAHGLALPDEHKLTVIKGLIKQLEAV